MTQELRDEARRREEERDDKARRRELFFADVRTLARRPEGRRFLRWIIDQGDIFADGFHHGPAGAFRAGARATSLRVWRLLREALSSEEFVSVAVATDADEPVEGRTHG